MSQSLHISVHHSHSWNYIHHTIWSFWSCCSSAILHSLKTNSSYRVHAYTSNETASTEQWKAFCYNWALCTWTFKRLAEKRYLLSGIWYRLQHFEYMDEQWIRLSTNMTWCKVMQHDMTWHDMTWYDITQHDLTWCDAMKYFDNINACNVGVSTMMMYQYM